MGRGFVAMRLDAFDLGFEQHDALVEFILRIGCEVLGRELARGIALGARKIAFVHVLSEHRKPIGLLSIREAVIARELQRIGADGAQNHG